MAGVMMALGPFNFSLDTAAYQELRRTVEFRWAEHERLGRKPAQQFLGAASETISLSGIIYPHFRGGIDQIEQIEVLGATGKPQLVVDGLGFVWGEYCIKSVEETRRVFFSNGVPRKIEFALRLVEYGGE